MRMGANLFLGCWLMLTPAFGGSPTPLFWSDLLSGGVVCALALWELSAPQAWKRWGLCFIGLWLLFAPLIFWAPTSNAYTTNTLIGLLLMIFSSPLSLNSAVEIPPGWSYNPSAWHHRTPVIILALAGFFIARIMAAYQLGHIDSIWEPFFGPGTKRVLTSEVAKAFPISDAGLGAIAYALEGVSGVVGDERRWKTMPWMVFLFFVLVVPAGVVSIVLIMLQPVVVGAWCTLCLMTAVLTLISIPPAVDEIFASCQFLAQVRRERKSVWKAFWGTEESWQRKPAASSHNQDTEASSVRGIDFRWNFSCSAVLGIWVIWSPKIWDMSPAVANSNYIVGALTTTFAVLATAEPIRMVRFLNVICGIWLVIVPLIFGPIEGKYLINQLISGLLLIPLSLPKGPITEKYGNWNRFIF